MVDLFRYPTVSSLARHLALPTAMEPVPGRAQERAERSRAATRQGRFLEARKRHGRARAAAPRQAAPRGEAEAEALHARLSRAERGVPPLRRGRTRKAWSAPASRSWSATAPAAPIRSSPGPPWWTGPAWRRWSA